jgi:hypothetical protein
VRGGTVALDHQHVVEDLVGLREQVDDGGDLAVVVDALRPIGVGERVAADDDAGDEGLGSAMKQRGGTAARRPMRGDDAPRRTA